VERRSVRSRVLVAVAAMATVTATMVAAAPGAMALTPPAVPAAIAVPPGNTLFLVGHARGAQVYKCVATGSTFAWTLQYPAAVLYDDAGHAIVTHYAGPTWRAYDGSTVVGTRVASAPAPVPGAIPWLLLSARNATPANHGLLAPTTYIQRINTTGGVAPSTGCDAAHVGAIRAVPYTADYYFYKAAPPVT
jgi:hypothetical protein